jgi:hypothetical protein
MTFKIWFNKDSKKPEEAWVIQQQPISGGDLGLLPGRVFLAPTVDVFGHIKFVEAAPGQTPTGWAEVEGAISVDGSTNVITIRNEK